MSEDRQCDLCGRGAPELDLYNGYALGCSGPGAKILEKVPIVVCKWCFRQLADATWTPTA